jgi:putative SOS response-associated peptidase YedK
MCGRYRRRSDKQRIAETFHVGMDLADIYLEPEEDVAPGSIQPVVLSGDTGEREIALMRWGFKLPDRHLFNARSEGIERAAFWKDSFQKRRCIVPADAFFEWSDTGQKKKSKYEVVIPGREPFAMAGVWRPWKNPKTDQWERTFAVITGEPNELMGPIHDRLTTILDPRDYEEYLTVSARTPVHLLRILPSEEMRLTRVEDREPAGPQLNLFDLDRS